VQNVPGAGGLKSVAFLDSQPDDGTVIGTFSSGLLTEAVVSPERVRIDFRNYAFIGNVSDDVRVCYLWHTAAVRTWAELVARNEVVFAASAAGTAGNADIAMLRELFGIKVREVDGYPGSADKRLAVEKGEVDGDCGGWTSLPADWLRDGKVNVIVRLSPTLLPGMDGKAPFAGDLLASERDRAVFDFVTAPEQLGRLFMISGRVAADRVAALRRAFDAMVADPAFVAEAGSLRLTVAPMSGSDVARDVAKLYAAPPDLVARAKAIAGE
jgi:tripartite-type tricarboxylate transporter receptor subunit TctC